MTRASALIEHLAELQDEMSRPKHRRAKKVGSYSKDLAFHLAKLKFNNGPSNWLGTIRKHIDNMANVTFNKHPSASDYFLYTYVTPLHDGMPWRRSTLGRLLIKAFPTATETDFESYVITVEMVFKQVSLWLAEDQLPPKILHGPVHHVHEQMKRSAFPTALMLPCKRDKNVSTCTV